MRSFPWRSIPFDHGAEHLTRLEEAHHEICTALTVVYSNVALIRVRLRDGPPSSANEVRRHLDEVEAAVERLRRFSAELKRWHDATPPPAKGTRQG